MRKFILFSAMLVLTFSVSPSRCEIPKLINYQGMLTDEFGNPLTGSYDLTFYIYDDTTGGNLKWSETQNGVQVENGLFNVVLGNQTVLNIAFNESYWLAVKVGTETMPRIRITSVGYAYRAQWSDTAQYAHAVTPGSGSLWSVSDSVLYTSKKWGVARGGSDNELYGDSVHTHVNLGVACTTGTSGQSYEYCIVGGGFCNKACRDYSTVGGGSYNNAERSYATVSGGRQNTAEHTYATVGGGYQNTSMLYATVAGGINNNASGNSATIAGGSQNVASSYCANVGGGSHNIASDQYSTVGGGYGDTASGYAATVGGGEGNIADGYYATLGGGIWNTADGDYATVGGGASNRAGGYCAAVVGGAGNVASGDYSFAAGHRAKANHTGVFVWADNTYADFASTGEDQFLIRAAGGVGIGVTNPEEMLEIENAAADQRAFLKIQTSHPTQFEEVGIRLETPQNRWHLRMDDHSNDNLPDVGSLALRSQNSGIEVMTWTNSGNVGIGTTSPTEKLDVDGTARLRGISAGSATPVHVDGSGKLWKQSSSRRYKHSIKKLEADSEKVLDLRPVSFKWKATQGEDVGLIAEDVEQVLPELVVHDEEGRPDAVKYDKVALYLLELVKSQQERISALEQEMAELKR